MLEKFTKEELLQRAFRRCALVMYEMWEEKGSSDTRILHSPLIPDEYVYVGDSLDGTDHKEHIVPRMVICKGCHEIFEKGKLSGLPKSELIVKAADLIQKHLKIVRISRAEQQRLDHKSKLNLKQRMPENWSFEDGDPFARLKLANIQFTTKK